MPHLSLIVASFLVHALAALWLRERLRAARREIARPSAARGTSWASAPGPPLEGGSFLGLVGMCCAIVFAVLVAATSGGAAPRPPAWQAAIVLIGLLHAPAVAAACWLAAEERRGRRAAGAAPSPFFARLGHDIALMAAGHACGAWLGAAALHRPEVGTALVALSGAGWAWLGHARGFVTIAAVKAWPVAAAETGTLRVTPLFGQLAAVSARFVPLGEEGWMPTSPAGAESEAERLAPPSMGDSAAAEGCVPGHLVGDGRRRGWERWWATWSPDAPTIPTDLVRTMDADVLTAAVALRYCVALGEPRKRPLAPETSWREGGGSRAGVVVIALVVGAAILGGGGGVGGGVLPLVALLLPIVMLVLVAGQRGDWSRNHLQTRHYRNALALWRTLCAPRAPTAAAFVRHLAEFDSAIAWSTSPETLWERHAGSLHVARLLGGRGTREHAEFLDDLAAIVGATPPA